MSTETLHILQDIAPDTDSPEMQIALQCAPVLLRRKVSNLLIVREKHEHRVLRLFQSTGLSVTTLGHKNGRTTFLVYDRKPLEKYIMQDKVSDFLFDKGYDTRSFESVLECLIHKYERLSSGSTAENKNVFPHEIGIFLGYPLDDVKGFIDNKGSDYLASGYWKVYSEPERKKKIFMNYDNAVDIVVRKIRDGKRMEEILC